MAKIKELTDNADFVEVEHKGVTYQVKKIDKNDPPVAFLEALEDERGVAMCRYLMGDEQWKTFMQSDPKASDLRSIVERGIGAEPGKSGTSSDS